VFTYGNAVFTEEKLCCADDSFLNIFTYPLVKGNVVSILSSLLVLLIALLTMSLQTIKAARTNPADALRSE
jgi:ABC-type antimicrobial peptide transport system permease subunit